MCWPMKLPFVLVVVMVLRTTMFVTVVFVTESQVLCGSFCLLWLWCYRTNICDRWYVTWAEDDIWLFISLWVLVNLPAPHPICVAVGTYLHFYLGMVHWLWLELLLWWIWQCFGPLCLQYWNCQWISHDLWCCNGHEWVRGHSYVLWIFLQKFCQTPLCILLHSPPCHMCIYI